MENGPWPTLINSGLMTCIKALLESPRWPTMSTSVWQQKTKTRLWILMPLSRPESTLPVFPCGSAADLPPDWQPLVSTWTSGTAGGHISVFFSAPYEERFIIFSLPLQNIYTFLSHSSQASPVQQHFITILLFLLLTFFLLTICLNDSITLTSKVQSICLQMQEVLLSWLYIDCSHIFLNHPLIAEEMQLLAKLWLLSARPLYEAKASVCPAWLKIISCTFITTCDHAVPTSTNMWYELTVTYSQR